ncbi:class A beta-lactamase-related serine hydrolase [Pseudonocardiaceae bacterium YIM PH 21723]|nr:class A beta-lactamase-related serine hydrolase [Pseudonocardiaceae bacterium YIM PH 21723]
MESVVNAAELFSAVAWSTGTPAGPVSRGLLGTRSWDGPPLTEDSLFDLASVTKPIVAIAVLSLVDRGVLGLDDPIDRYLPGRSAEITIRQLLNHTSGLPGSTPLYRDHPTRESLLAAIGPVKAPPGTVVEYSSQGFILLGLIASAATGSPLDHLVADLVTRPLGMTSTRFGPVTGAVATEDCPWRGRVVCGEVHDENAVVLGGICGHAGLFSTLADMETLGRSLTAGLFPFPGMRTCQTEGLNLRRTLGWQLDTPGLSPIAYGHTGFTGTSLWIDGDRYHVLLTNRVHPSRHSDDIVRIRREFHSAVSDLAEHPFDRPHPETSQVERAQDKLDQVNGDHDGHHGR